MAEEGIVKTREIEVKYKERGKFEIVIQEINSWGWLEESHIEYQFETRGAQGKEGYQSYEISYPT